MAAGDILRDGARGAGRLMPIFLPGFALVVAVHAHLGASPPYTVGAFLILLLLLPFVTAVLGLIVQALRFVTFDWIVKRIKGDPVNEDSPDAHHYALYANLSIFWGVFTLSSIFAHCFRSWEKVGRDIGYVIFFLVIWYALSRAAMLAYHRSHRFARPADARKRKTTRKKTT